MFEFFSTNTRQSRRIPENVEMPSDYGGDTLLCKQCQVLHMSPTCPPDKTDSAPRIPSSICPRHRLHLAPIGSNDRVCALVTSNSQHKASRVGQWLPLQGKLAPDCVNIPPLLFFRGEVGSSSLQCHPQLYSSSV